MANIAPSQPHVIILIPAFNDWAALEKLLDLIHQTNLAAITRLEVLIVDDYSTQPPHDSLRYQTYQKLERVSVLRLMRNLGHQRAIAVGLSYVYHHLKGDMVVVMDGDGEDNPFEIERLLDTSMKLQTAKIIFARRSKRSESFVFKISYYVYKELYALLTGKKIGVGNFSLIPISLLNNVVVISEIWNHYSSGIYRSKIPLVEVDVPRAKRLDGKPKMNFVSLVTHGLSSIAVYGDVVGTRILLSTGLVAIFLSLLLGLVVIIRLFTDWAIPGWATYVSGLLILSIFQLILIGTVFSMIILSARNQSSFIPARDYELFVDDFYPLTQ
ncbi:MAG: glycosyltransferase [Cyanobacteria bacterium J06555_13]